MRILKLEKINAYGECFECGRSPCICDEDLGGFSFIRKDT
jgi:hypothetical protein